MGRKSSKKNQGFDMKEIPVFPPITIVTVVYNGVDFLEETILSVIGQTYPNIDYVVIDGGSTDGTLEIIEKYQDKISYWISEPDKGIYDAMNKGIHAAKGEWFNFLNAGDSFVNENILNDIFTTDTMDATLIYGDIKVLTEKGHSYNHPASTLVDDKSIRKGMSVCHQAIFYSSKILKPYDQTLRLKAEWKHLIHMTKHKDFKPLKFNFPFVYYRTGGVGARQLKLNQTEYRKVFLEEYGRKEYMKYIPFFVYMTVRRIAKRILQR
jgi:glycosyltransferase involved in cell wall biosynthesis